MILTFLYIITDINQKYHDYHDYCAFAIHEY